MYNLPITFHLTADAVDGIQNSWTTVAGEDPDQPLMMAIPESFNGPGGALSPEDLYGMAILNCFIATFKVIAASSNFSFENLSTELTIQADKNDKGQLWIARAHLKATLHGASAPDKAERLMQKACQNCLIMNSVNTEKTYEFSVA